MPELEVSLESRSPRDLEFRLSKGATLPAVVIQVLDQGESVDLTGGTALFSMVDDSDVAKITGAAAVITDELNGIVSYSWATGDTDTEGKFFGQFQVTVGGSLYLLPDNEEERLIIRVSAALAFV